MLVHVLSRTTDVSPDELNQERGALVEAHRKANEQYELGCAQMERWGKELQGLADMLIRHPAEIYGPLGQGVTPVSGSEWRPSVDLPFMNLEWLAQKSEQVRRFRDERDSLAARLSRLGIL